MLFTHSYYSGKPAELNPLADYIADVKIVRLNTEHHKTSRTNAAAELQAQGYIYSEWLDSGYTQLAVFVKPSDSFLAEAEKRIGGYPSSMQFIRIKGSDLARVCWSARVTHDNSFTNDVIAGDVLAADFLAQVRAAKFYGDGERLIIDMYRRMEASGPAYKAGRARAVYVAIAAVTGQPSLMADALRGQFDDFYLFDSHKCFIRRNWKVRQPQYCQQCGGTDH